eukprot:TRINITY_DN4559_c0_g1_i1.p1 TRINITY_DN4559_c0_g1~~TRINITY_DN4559_c0_g1_i1.p1  ORF type:complete len:374 (-),score=129.81 TRINITY_DN4559_c0_g1_i1:1237-2358(-)
MRHRPFLSETTIILKSIKTTIDNLLQMRTFLPQPMLEKVQQDESGARPPLRRSRSRSEGPPVSELGKPEGTSPRHFDPENPTDAVLTMQRVVAATFDRHLANKPVTVLFVRFTELQSLQGVEGDGLPPADFLQWYEAGVGAATTVCQQLGGDFLRLLGDTLLFTWGAVRPTGAPCVKACHAALGVHTALRALDQGPGNLPKYDALFAIVTGTALCGVMGTVHRRDFYVIGSLIHRGQRLGALNDGYGTRIVIDACVAQQCKALFHMQVCGLVEVRRPRGPPAEPQFVWELLGAVPERRGDDSEWMYQLAVQEDGNEGLYQRAMDALLKGQLAKGSRDLQAVLLQCPDHPHAARMLGRVTALDPIRQSTEALVD